MLIRFIAYLILTIMPDKYFAENTMRSRKIIFLIIITTSCVGCVSVKNNNEKFKAVSSSSLLTNKLLDMTAHGMAKFDDIKQLVEKGAKTENILVSDLSYNNNIDCRSVLYILKRNSYLYNDPVNLNSKPNNPYIKESDNHPRKEDLAYLADTGDGKTICNEAINFLARLSPNMKNVQIKYDGSTAAHQYLKDIHHPDWSLDIAKLLISKGNVNKRRFEDGFTPAHVFLLENRKICDKKNNGILSSIIKEVEKKGGDLNIKSNYYFDHGKRAGISLVEILSKLTHLCGKH